MIFLNIFTAFSQSPEKVSDYSFNFLFINDIKIENVLNDFIKDATDRGLDEKLIVNYIKKLDYIYVSDSLESDKLGSIVVGDKNNYILINKHKIDSYIDIKIILYHELGHWFGLNHNDGKIMENKMTFFDLDKWDSYITELFINVRKSILNSNTMKPYRE